MQVPFSLSEANNLNYFDDHKLHSRHFLIKIVPVRKPTAQIVLFVPVNTRDNERIGGWRRWWAQSPNHHLPDSVKVFLAYSDIYCFRKETIEGKWIYLIQSWAGEIYHPVGITVLVRQYKNEKYDRQLMTSENIRLYNNTVMQSTLEIKGYCDSITT